MAYLRTLKSCLLALCFGYFSVASAADLVRQFDSILIPAVDQFAATRMSVQVFKPDGPGPFTVVLFAHGRAASESERASFSTPIPDGHVNFWLRKGFAVVAPLRPGYGPGGGPDRERSGSKVVNHQCKSEGDLRPFLKHGMLALKTAHDWVRMQSWAKKDQIIMEGQSVGGLLTVAYSSENPSGVVGFINFSGGAAGYPADHIGRSCSENQITRIYEIAGETNRIPNLWLYAQNDGFWGSAAPKHWYYVFSKGANLGQSKFILTPPVEGKDGHYLLNYGGKYWGDPVSTFVKSLNLQ